MHRGQRSKHLVNDAKSVRGTEILPFSRLAYLGPLSLALRAMGFASIPELAWVGVIQVLSSSGTG